MITVALIEDDPEFRRIMTKVLQASGLFQLTGAYASAEEALDVLSALCPQVLLCDISLPGKSGIEVVRKVAQLHPSPACVMLTIFEDSEKLFDSLQAGAVGYLIKSEPVDTLLAGIAEAAAGGSPMSRAIARKVVRHFTTVPPQSNQVRELLSPREGEVLEWLAQGARYKEIADRLGISIETVKNHLRKIYEKLQVSSRTEATARFLRG